MNNHVIYKSFFASLTALLALIFLSSLSKGSSKEPLAHFNWTNLPLSKVSEIQKMESSIHKSKDHHHLLLAKRGLINGNLSLATHYLDKINDHKTAILPIKIRYLAIIDFIKGQYQKVIKRLEHKAFNQINYYKHICLLKIMAMMSLPLSGKLQIEISKCKSFNNQDSINEFMWLNNMELLKHKDIKSLRGKLFKDINTLLDTPELIRIWLKTGLYLNEGQLISKNLSALPSSAYKSKRFRELMGFYYYRLGDYAKARDFVEDITTANSENIKGNIHLKNKKNELAFAHFKLALQKNGNSLNALKRAIPLAWKLKQWKDGDQLIGKLVGYDLDKNKLLALKVAFQIKQGNLRLAKKNLFILRSQYREETPLIIGQMLSYVSLKLNDAENLKKMSYEACKKLDGLNCWIYGQLSIWENISKTSKRNDPIISLKNFSIEDLKGKAILNPLKEKVTIDQYDIEELDSNALNLGHFIKKNK